MESLKKHKNKVIISIFFAIIGVALSVIPYYTVSLIIRKIIEGIRDVKTYIPLILITLMGFIGGQYFHMLSTLISHHLAFGIIEEKRKLLTDKLKRISMGQVEKKSSGQWAQFMVETLDKLEVPIAHIIPEVISNFLIPIVLVVIIFILDWRIGIANLITIPLGILFTSLMMRGYEEKSRRYQNASKSMNTAMVEYVHGIKLIKAFNKTASSYEKFKETVKENKDSMLDWYLSVCFSMTAAMEILPSTMIFVLPTSLYLFINGSASVGVIVMCILLSYASYRPLIKAMSHLDTMANIKVIFGEINDIMKIEELERGSEYQKINGNKVEFKNVDFAYDENQKVLDKLSFTANENELTAIVGDSGSGKSTIAKLMAGFWNIDEGEILIGDASIRKMPLKQNMELVTYVSQDNFLFNKTILENLKIANEDASFEEIVEACKKASCHEFIEELPDGYNTICGEAGTNLSGGERQRIVIARALIKNSPVVLLDEATAYSDPDNELVIQKSINNLIKDKTVIMIAHRLSTIVNADKILVVDKGKIIEEGNHKELLSLKGKYYNMWESYTQSKEIEVI